MANHKSAIKRHKQSLVRKERNRIVRSTLKSVAKKVEIAVSEKNTETAGDIFKAASIALDKAANKGVIHKKTAARKKSRLAKKVNSLSA